MNQRAALNKTIEIIQTQFTWGDIPLSRKEIVDWEHIKTMPERMSENFSEGKIGRWLGWVQGVACAHRWLLLDDVKKINKEFSDG